MKCRFAFLIIQRRNAYSKSSGKRKLSEGEKGVRNWSWPLTRMTVRRASTVRQNELLQKYYTRYCNIRSEFEWMQPSSCNKIITFWSSFGVINSGTSVLRVCTSLSKVPRHVTNGRVVPVTSTMLKVTGTVLWPCVQRFNLFSDNKVFMKWNFNRNKNTGGNEEFVFLYFHLIVGLNFIWLCIKDISMH